MKSCFNRINHKVLSLIAGIFTVILFFHVPAGAQTIEGGESWESLRARPYPEWFKQSRLGIFIHWGVYSVPSYGGAESYAEWYLRGLQAGAQNRIDFMKKNYGDDFTYRDFAPLFKAELFDANEWAEIFSKAGAGYIVMVTKHHDGYCLWPSKYAPGWNSMENGPKRDLVGELAEAVRKLGIRFGAYYSLPEWGHPLHRWYEDPNDSIARYVEQHMIPQFKEMVSAYRPDLIFTDGEWFNTAEDWHARELISWYYQLVGSDAIVNDRWGHGADIGFKTPEYSSGGLNTDRPWAEVRGLGRSFGLNRNEKLSAYMSPRDLIHLFARTVAYGGGLIINVGPGADGKIPLLQQERIEALGEWLSTNREAIEGSKTWIRNGEEKEVELRHTDPQVNFNWVRNSPGYPIVEDNFTAAWEGFIVTAYTEEYTFAATADDGVRIYINGKLLIDKWAGNAEGTDSEAMRQNNAAGNNGKIKLEKGRYYPIKIEYREEHQNASVSLSWKSKSLPEEIVPEKNLFTSDGQKQANGLSAVYRSMRQYMAYTVNHGNLYAICFEWPEKQLEFAAAEPPKGMKVSLLGRVGYLPWSYNNGKITVDVSGITYAQMPGHYAWTFRFEGME
jgi:alpha-L-fucosidase